MGGGWFILGCEWGKGGGSHLLQFLGFFSCAFVFSFFRAWRLLCLFLWFLFSSSLAPLIKSYWCIKMLCLLCKTILKVRYLINILWISLEKGECFDFNHPLGFLLYSIHHHYTYRLSLSFQLADLLSLFVLPTCFDAGSPLEVKTPSS